MSNINVSTLRSDYPVAGQDNDSQGFRDNFSSIKTALTAAHDEINNLELNTAKLNAGNNFNGYGLSNSVFSGNSIGVNNGTGYDTGTEIGVSDGQTDYILYGHGDYVRKTFASTSATVQVTGWPTDGNLGHITLEVDQDTTSTRTLIFTGTTYLTDGPKIVPGATGGYGNASIVWNGNTIYASTSSGYQIWDLWSRDSGATVFLSLRGVYS